MTQDPDGVDERLPDPLAVTDQHHAVWQAAHRQLYDHYNPQQQGGA